MHTWKQLTIDGGEVMVDGQDETVRRPPVEDALRAVADAADPEGLDIKVVEIRITAGGQAVFRLTPSDGGQSIGGVVTVD